MKENLAEFLQSELQKLNLFIKRFVSSKEKDNLILVIYFSDEILDQVAEINEV